MPTQFSQEKFPPAPILEISLSQPLERAQTELLPALIDTGADFTMVALHWLLQIDAPEIRSAHVRGLWSERQLVTLYLVDIHLETGVLSGVEVIGIDSTEEHFDDADDEIILGRNVLNKLFLLFEGPNKLFLLFEGPNKLTHIYQSKPNFS